MAIRVKHGAEVEVRAAATAGASKAQADKALRAIEREDWRIKQANEAALMQLKKYT